MRVKTGLGVSLLCVGDDRNPESLQVAVFCAGGRKPVPRQ